MLLILEIGMLIWGIIALCSGRIQWNPDRPIKGIGARVGGLILMVPLPLALFLGFVIGLYHDSRGVALSNSTFLLLIVSEWGMTLFFLVLSGAVSSLIGTAKRKKRRRVEEDSEDEYEYRSRRRSSYADSRDEDDYPRRRRYEDDEDDNAFRNRRY